MANGVKLPPPVDPNTLYSQLPQYSQQHAPPRPPPNMLGPQTSYGADPGRHTMSHFLPPGSLPPLLCCSAPVNLFLTFGRLAAHIGVAPSARGRHRRLHHPARDAAGPVSDVYVPATLPALQSPSECMLHLYVMSADHACAPCHTASERLV